MPKKIAKSTLNASTIDIINTIRRRAPYEYQQSVPVVETARDIPVVGEVIYGNPALSNQFLGELINGIALTLVQSANYNNPYAALRKGVLDFGEIVEDVFVGLAKVIRYDPHKAKYRELQRTIPEMRSAFYARNWQVIYPVTIEDDELRRAFSSEEGVQDLIVRITQEIYSAYEYDNFLLIKYLLIQSVTSGQMAPVSVGDGDDLTACATEMRAMSSKLGFMADKYNRAHVQTTTPAERQIIFMDADFNAKFDVEVLAAAFNMEKADFLSRIFLIDDFTTFDNDRFSEIASTGDNLPPITDDQLAAMATVKAILIDENFIQWYSNLEKFTEKYSAAGLYWNYFYHSWQTFATSPFANAVVFIADDPTIYTTLTGTIRSVSRGDDHDDVYGVVALDITADSWDHGYEQVTHVQTPEAIAKTVAVEEYGAYSFERATDDEGNAVTVTPYIICNGQTYAASDTISMDSVAGTTLTFSQVDSVPAYNASQVTTTAAKSTTKKAGR